jgi:hypothetical protein
VQEIARILPTILKRQVQRRNPPVLEILGPLWERIAGRAVAQRCRPVAFAQGTLTLAAECPTWSAQLSQLTEEIRAEINSFLGEPVVRKLRVQRVGQLEADFPARPAGPSLPVTGRKSSAASDAATKSTYALALARSYSRAISRRHRKEH